LHTKWRAIYGNNTHTGSHFAQLFVARSPHPKKFARYLHKIYAYLPGNLALPSDGNREKKLNPRN